MPRKASIGATRDSAVYRVRIPDDLKSEWEAHCEKKGSAIHEPHLLKDRASAYRGISGEQFHGSKAS